MYLEKPKPLIIWNILSNFPILLQPRNSSKQTLLLMIYIEKRINFSGGHWTCAKISSRSRYLQSAQAHTWTCIWLTSRSKPSPPAPGGTTWTARWFTKCKKTPVLLHFLICSHHFCPTCLLSPTICEWMNQLVTENGVHVDTDLEIKN